MASLARVVPAIRATPLRQWTGAPYGDVNHPWNLLQGIFGPRTGLSGASFGYPYPLLASMPYNHPVATNPATRAWTYAITPDPIEFGGHGGPIHPGDEIVLQNGTYAGFNAGFGANNMPGAVIAGDPEYNPSTGLGNLRSRVDHHCACSRRVACHSDRLLERAGRRRRPWSCVGSNKWAVVEQCDGGHRSRRGSRDREHRLDRRPSLFRALVGI